MILWNICFYHLYFLLCLQDLTTPKPVHTKNNNYKDNYTDGK